MKNFRTYALIAFATVSLTACIDNDDDGNIPEIVNEEEVITTVRLTLRPTLATENVTLTSIDLDGDGPDAPVITVSGPLFENSEYTGDILFLNEAASPAEDITVEVVEEAEEHQVFYIPSTSLDATIGYANFDSNNDPLGTSITLTTGGLGSGTLTVTLRHEPTKPNDGTLSDAGGETDVQVIFPVEIVN